MVIQSSTKPGTQTASSNHNFSPTTESEVPFFSQFCSQPCGNPATSSDRASTLSADKNADTQKGDSLNTPRTLEFPHSQNFVDGRSSSLQTWKRLWTLFLMMLRMAFHYRFALYRTSSPYSTFGLSDVTCLAYIFAFVRVGPRRFPRYKDDSFLSGERWSSATNL